MLNHQKSFAQVNVGSRRLADSQIFSPRTRAFDCCQNRTSDKSRKYHPLATHPWSRGIRPVVNVDWTEEVTAGNTVFRALTPPRSHNARRLGVASPMSAGVNPTTFRTRVRCMGVPGASGRAARYCPPTAGPGRSRWGFPEYRRPVSRFG